MKKFSIPEYADFYGIIAEKENEDVYRLGAEIIDIPKSPFKYSDLKVQYNQNSIGRYSCTLFGSMGAVSDLTGKVWSMQDQRDIYDQSLKLGLDPNQGWFISDAVDLIRKNYFRIYNQELLSFAVDVDSELFYDALTKGYSVVMGYSGNKDFNIDYKDGILDGTSFGTGTYGHCVRMTQTDVDIYEMVVDNYLGRDPNTYKIKKANLKDLVKNKVFYKKGYIFVIKKDFEELNLTSGFFANVPLWATVSVEKAIKAKLITTKSDLNEIVGTNALEEILIKLGVFTKAIGSVSLVRWIVALDKLGRI
jgi:hypothetical protein